MRTILSFLFAASLFAQTRYPGDDVERLEQTLAKTPENQGARTNLLQRYAAMTLGTDASVAEALEGHRRQIEWFIEHHPDAPVLGGMFASIDPKGPPADPAGYAEVARMWRARGEKPGAPPAVVANAVQFFRVADRREARTLLEIAWTLHPGDPNLARARGILDAIELAGATRIDHRGLVASVDPELRKSPEAMEARRDIEGSAFAPVPAYAGEFLLQNFGLFLRDGTLGDEDPLKLAADWIGRAHRMDLKNAEWVNLLITVYQRDAAMTLDPASRTELLEKAVAVAQNDGQRLRAMPDLLEAEFDAGDSKAAARDARKLLEMAAANPKAGNHDDLVQAGETMLGRVALDQGRSDEAKERLLESARGKDSGGLRSNGPKMTLAQDLLDSGDRDTVLQFLDLCRTFWKFDQGRIDHYEKLIRAQPKPDLLARWTPPGYSLVQQNAPTFALKDLSGAQWTLDRLAGKVVALEFWNTSCKSCSAPLAALEKYDARDVVKLAVNVGDDELQMRAFRGTSLPMAPAGNVARQYEVSSYPTLAVIDRKGKVAAYYVGDGNDGVVQSQVARGIAGFGEKPILPAPARLSSSNGKLTWAAIPGAQSYVVEWERARTDGSFQVIPTLETSVAFREPGAVRWRVYGVPRYGEPGEASSWQGVPGR